MDSNYITSSELETINGKDYLHLYLNPDYSFKYKLNGDEVSSNELYIQAPTLSPVDTGDIRKVTSVINKFQEMIAKEEQKRFTQMSEEDRDSFLKSLQKQIKELEKEENIKKDEDEDLKDENLKSVKNFLISLFENSKSYETENSNFFKEFDKITNFLKDRLNRRINDDNLLKTDFSIFDIYLGEKDFIIEEIFIEYLSFFFKHFPLRSLFRLNKK